MSVLLPDIDIARSEIAALEGYLLGSIEVHPPDALSANELIAVRAYLLLAHATIEEFVESCFVQYLRACSEIDENGRAHPGAFLSILQLADDIGGQLNNSVRSPKLISEKIPGLYRKKFVDVNHGVRKSNIKRLAIGAGLSWGEIEESCSGLLTSCETLGAKRGATAHISAAAVSDDGLSQQLYPEDVRRYTNDALRGVDDLRTFLLQSLGSHIASSSPKRP